MYSPRVLPDAGVSESQNWATVEFFFTGSAAGTPHVLLSKQSAAGPKVWFVTGNGTVGIGATKANALVKRPDLRPLDSVLTNLSIGLQTYMTAVPAAADGAFCHAFAIGGMTPGDIMKAEVVITPVGTAARNATSILVNQSAPVIVHQVSLNGSNQFLQDDGTTAVVAGTNTLVIVGGQGPQGGASSQDGADSIVFGAIDSTDVLDTISAGDKVTLRLYLKC